MIVALFILVSYLLLFVFSYFWVDLNLTLASFPPINNLIGKLQHLGYFNRLLSSKLYLAILLLLFAGQLYFFSSQFLRMVSLKHLWVLTILVAFIATLSYPFLSHDIFTYLFQSKIIWHYHQSPYLKAPEGFSDDPWLRFTHWTERTAPYGPVWLLYSLMPSLFSFGKFILNFYGLKLLNGILFLTAGILLLKMKKGDRCVFAYWFFNPFLLIELLTNAHNDLLMISLFFLSMFLLEKKKVILGWLSFLASILSSKYITLFFLPALILKGKRRVLFFNFMAGLLLFYLVVNFDRVHSWYFSWFFLVFPFSQLSWFSWRLVFILSALLMVFKYYSFILTGYWGEMEYR